MIDRVRGEAATKEAALMLARRQPDNTPTLRRQAFRV
jgi:hypothetical protein